MTSPLDDKLAQRVAPTAGQSAGLSRTERFKILSALLSYPEAGFSLLLEEAREACTVAGDEQMLATVNALMEVGDAQLVRCYVATFDMQEATSLYLTAHELGDSPERGGALLRLHALLRLAALEPMDGELPDFVPLLLEFLAEKPVGMPTEDLEMRLAVVCRVICKRLDETHPYLGVFKRLEAYFPDVEAVSEGMCALLAKPVTEPDIHHLPYPLAYD